MTAGGQTGLGTPEGGTRRLPISPLIDTYLVPDTAPQDARSVSYRPRAHHRPYGFLKSPGRPNP
eukprot:4891163-Prymnesium_polylepis.1